MEKHRQISSYFWTDSFTETLDPIEKLLYLYLFTNNSSNLAGVYQLSIRTMASETGIDRDMVKKILKRFEKEKKLLYIDNILALKNTAKNQALKNSFIVANIERTLKKSPQWAVDYISFNTDCPQPIDSSGKGKSKGISKSNVSKVLMEKWNNNNFRPITKLSNTRLSHLKSREKEKEFDIDKIIAKVNQVKYTDFIKNSNWFSFDWIIKNDTNYVKLLDGNYDGKQSVKREYDNHVSNDNKF